MTIKRKNAAHFSLAVALLTSATGCSSMLVGTWKAEKAPAGVPYYIQQVEFKKDGTFTAIPKRGGEAQPPLKGQYHFNGFALTLRSAGKAEDRNYRAALWGGNKLELQIKDQKHYLIKQ